MTYPFVNTFSFDQPDTPLSLYEYAPVYRVRDLRGDWVVKRTGLVHSTGSAIGAWLAALHRVSIGVVAPAQCFGPNPRRQEDGIEWVVYPL
jgi:spectinomycin phosphotransferase